jgi:hypothetical protein
MSTFQLELDESERHMLILALSKLSLTRPGWLGCLMPFVEKLQGTEMFEEFRRMGPDQPAAVAAANLGIPRDEESDCRTIEVMERFGGSFVKILAEAARHADEFNLARIKAAFPEYWTDYEAKHHWLLRERE